MASIVFNPRMHGSLHRQINGNMHENDLCQNEWMYSFPAKQEKNSPSIAPEIRQIQMTPEGYVPDLFLDEDFQQL